MRKDEGKAWTSRVIVGDNRISSVVFLQTLIFASLSTGNWTRQNTVCNTCMYLRSLSAVILLVDVWLGRIFRQSDLPSEESNSTSKLLSPGIEVNNLIQSSASHDPRRDTMLLDVSGSIIGITTPLNRFRRGNLDRSRLYVGQPSKIGNSSCRRFCPLSEIRFKRRDKEPLFGVKRSISWPKSNISRNSTRGIVSKMNFGNLMGQ